METDNPDDLKTGLLLNQKAFVLVIRTVSLYKNI